MARKPARADGPWLFCLVVGAGFCRAEVARNHQPEMGHNDKAVSSKSRGESPRAFHKQGKAMEIWIGKIDGWTIEGELHLHDWNWWWMKS